MTKTNMRLDLPVKYNSSKDITNETLKQRERDHISPTAYARFPTYFGKWLHRDKKRALTVVKKL